MSRASIYRALFTAIFASCLVSAFAQSSPAPAKQPPADQAKDQAKDQDKDKDKDKKEDKPKTIDDVTKDFTKMDGLVTLYRQTKDKKDTIYMELPESRFGKLMLIQITSASGMGDTSAGGLFHGAPLADIPVKFMKIDDDRLQLIAPNVAHRGDTFESKIGITRTFPDTIMSNFDVVAKQPDRHSVLIDVTSFFKSDVGDISTNVPSFGMDPSGTRVDTVKDFPDNFVFHTIYQLQRRGPATTGDPKSVPWAVSYNISDLPTDDGFRPRLGDPRVGFFTTDFEDLTDARQEFDANTSYILRWNVEKSDPSQAMSPPKKPIVFWIDNAVPKEYRDSVRAGILRWNKAFEREGISNAIQVNQMPDDADWDIADLRYNVVRWTTGMPFAIALFRANPLTGEILNACVNFDAGFAAAGSTQFDNVIDPSVAHLTIKDPSLPKPTIEPALASKYAPMLCDMQDKGKMVQAIGMEAAETLTPFFTEKDKDRLIQQYISQVTAHEVGHCLGLRHNFTASTQLTAAQLGDPAMVSKYGVSASVMDYLPFNASAIGHHDVDFYSQTVGTYDMWAIDYGYRQINADSPQSEVSTLRTIASQGSTPGHLYQSDRAADDVDPFVIRFDSSRQPMDYLEKMSGYGPKIRAGAKMRIANGESYYKFTRAWQAGLSAQINNALAANRFIGGGRLSSSFHGDPNEQPAYTPVDGAVQRRALRLMTTALFNENSVAINRKDLSMLTFNPKSVNNEAAGRARLFPVERQVANAQRLGLLQILDGDTLTRMRDNEFRVGPAGNTLTMAEMFHTLDNSVWSEVDGKRPVTDLRRELQRTYLDIMIPMALGESDAPNDARALALDQLVSLKHRIALAIPAEKDAYSGPHLRDCLGRINRALNAQAVTGVGQ